MTAPYGRFNDTGKVELSQETMKKTVADSVCHITSKELWSPGKKNKGKPMKKVSRVFDVQKNNQVKNNFTGVPDADPRASFNQSTWSPAI